jgi:hypothetical protein
MSEREPVPLLLKQPGAPEQPAPRPADVWVRFRFQRWRLPRDYPPDISPGTLFKQLLKLAGRRFGFGALEVREELPGQALAPVPHPAAQGEAPRPAAG